MKIVAFVFARGNFKEIKNENLLKFIKTTLLGYAINEAKKINGVIQVFVSFDSKKIFSYAKKFKAKTLFLRSNQKLFNIKKNSKLISGFINNLK